MDIVTSKNNVPVRLTEERWLHITEEHSEMAGHYFEVLKTLTEPEIIYEGKTDEYIAVKEIEKGKYILVVYKEINKKDGFVITAFLTKQKRQLERRKIIWKQHRN